MSRTSKIYAYFISVIGITLGSYCVFQYFHSVFFDPNPKAELMQFGVLLLLYILCRCLPIYIRKDYAIDMSFICNLATILCKGPVVSAAMVLIATPFIIVPTNTGDRTYDHLFNKPPIKTAFNAGNITISAFLAALVYQKTGGVIENINLTRNFIPAFLSVAVYQPVPVFPEYRCFGSDRLFYCKNYAYGKRGIYGASDHASPAAGKIQFRIVP